MDPDEVRHLVKMLLNVWEHAVGREDTLRLILNDCCPDWKHHYLKYKDDPGTIEHTKILVDRVREMSMALLDGSATPAMIFELGARLQKKPN